MFLCLIPFCQLSYFFFFGGRGRDRRSRKEESCLLEKNNIPPKPLPSFLCLCSEKHTRWRYVHLKGSVRCCRGAAGVPVVLEAPMGKPGRAHPTSPARRGAAGAPGQPQTRGTSLGVACQPTRRWGVTMRISKSQPGLRWDAPKLASKGQGRCWPRVAFPQLRGDGRGCCWLHQLPQPSQPNVQERDAPRALAW